MNPFTCRLRGALLCVALLAPFAAGAQEPPPGGPQMHGMPHERGAPCAGEGEMPAPPFLRGVNLSKEQRDKLADVMRAQAPQLREQHQAVADAHQALHELGLSAKFDEGKAGALAQTLGQAIAKAALQQARADQQIVAILSPEQRQQIERRPPPEGPRRPPRPQ